MYIHTAASRQPKPICKCYERHRDGLWRYSDGIRCEKKKTRTLSRNGQRINLARWNGPYSETTYTYIVFYSRRTRARIMKSRSFCRLNVSRGSVRVGNRERALLSRSRTRSFFVRGFFFFVLFQITRNMETRTVVVIVSLIVLKYRFSFENWKKILKSLRNKMHDVYKNFISQRKLTNAVNFY